MASAISLVVNGLIVTSAVSIPAAVAFNAQGTLPDLATIFILLFISMVIFRILGVPSLVEGLGTAYEETEEFRAQYYESDIGKQAEALNLRQLKTTPPLPEEESLSRCDSSEFPQSATSRSDSAIADFADPYISQFPALESEFLALADTVASPSSPPGTKDATWHTVLKQTWANFSIEIDKRADSDFFFRYVMHMEATPEEAFDLLADIKQRPAWDEMCEEADVVEKVSNRTTVQYFRTKGVWPTKPRAALLVGFSRQLGSSRYLNVTKSIDSHPDFIPQSCDVRMIANLAGQLVEGDPEGRPRMCRVVQVVDGDLGGYIPKSIVNLVTTKAIPVGMKKANMYLRNIQEQRTTSKIITIAEGEADAEGTGFRNSVNDQTFSAAAIQNLIKVEESEPLRPKSRNHTSLTLAIEESGPRRPRSRDHPPPILEIEGSGPRRPKPRNHTPPTLEIALSLQKPTPASTLPLRGLVQRTEADRKLLTRPSAVKFILNILRRSQPWVIISFLLAVIMRRKA